MAREIVFATQKMRHRQDNNATERDENAEKKQIKEVVELIVIEVVSAER